MTPQRQKGFKITRLHLAHHPQKEKNTDNSKNDSQWKGGWGQIEGMQKLSPHGSSTLAQVATPPSNFLLEYQSTNADTPTWNLSFQKKSIRWENWKMLSTMSLTVALTMKTNTPVFSIGFQYIRQLAKFGRKEAIFYPNAAIFLHCGTVQLKCARKISSSRFPSTLTSIFFQPTNFPLFDNNPFSIFPHIGLPFFWPTVGACSPWQLLLLLAEPLSTSCAYWLPSSIHYKGVVGSQNMHSFGTLLVDQRWKEFKTKVTNGIPHPK